MFRFVLVCILVLPGFAFAEKGSFHPTLILNKIEKLEAMEKNRDELYLSVTVFPNKETPVQFSIPQSPLYWPSDSVSQVKNLKIWAQSVPNDSGVTLILELLERDSPPWNTDDLIGELKLRIKNDNGKARALWLMPNHLEMMPKEVKWGQPITFDLVALNAHYKITFTLKE